MIGIIPAGGSATRVNGLPKYLFPVPGGYLLERLIARMFASRIVIAANSRNYATLWSYASDDATIIARDSATICGAVLDSSALSSSLSAETILFGMPDTYWTDDIVYERLVSALYNDADVAVAVWHIRDDQRGKLGQCQIDENSHIQDIVDKDPNCPLPYAWGAIAWRPSFWTHIKATDAHLGVPICRAIQAGLTVTAVPMAGRFYDCGTADEYFRCIRETTEVIHATV